MYTLRDFVKTPEGLEGALAIVKGIGYAGVQLSAVAAMDYPEPKVSAEQAADLLHHNDLVCTCTHRPLERLLQNTEEEIAFHRSLGCALAGVGYIRHLYGVSLDGFRRFIADTREMRAKLADSGIQFAYHNHDFEYIRDPETRQHGMHVLAEEAPDLQFIIDTYWVQNSGADPVAQIRKLKGRVDAVHLKDKEVTEEDGPVMSPVGEGNMPWPEILAACRDAGTKYYIVEQDTCRRDPFDCLAASARYLNGLLG